MTHSRTEGAAVSGARNRIQAGGRDAIRLFDLVRCRHDLFFWQFTDCQRRRQIVPDSDVKVYQSG